jgi:tetratricopeptide (TPR) repeat protein
MTPARLRAILLVAMVPCAAGCTRPDDLAARYRLEQELWQAQFHQRKINISVVRASHTDMQLAIAAFDRVLADDPLSSRAAARWDPNVVADIRRIQLETRIALANLYFLSERYEDAGTMYERTLGAADLGLERTLDARLGAARSLYLAGESSEVMHQCAEMFRQISTSEEFWSGRFVPDPVFIDIPVVLVRLYRESGDQAKFDEFRPLAGDFYQRVAATWPEKDIAWQALLGDVQLHLVDKNWSGAADRIAAIIDQPGPATTADREGLRLLLGEIYAFALRDTTRAEETLAAVERSSPESALAYAARYDRAAMKLESGDADAAMRAFRALEQDQKTPGDVAARAMFARAKVLEGRGAWDEAVQLLRRMQQLYPYAPPSIEAPIIVTRHYVATGESVLAERTIERAREYYLSLLDRNGPYPGNRMGVQDALAESYASAGRAAEGAALLGSAPSAWDDASTAAGLLKSAEVYATVLNDSVQAREMLKKCIERFPETRYSKMAARRLDELSATSAAP